jgi:hypothetical protein
VYLVILMSPKAAGTLVRVVNILHLISRYLSCLSVLIALYQLHSTYSDEWKVTTNSEMRTILKEKTLAYFM